MTMAYIWCVLVYMVGVANYYMVFDWLRTPFLSQVVQHFAGNLEVKSTQIRIDNLQSSLSASPVLAVVAWWYRHLRFGEIFTLACDCRCGFCLQRRVVILKLTTVAVHANSIATTRLLQFQYSVILPG
jgi:hypothetical protein